MIQNLLFSISFVILTGQTSGKCQDRILIGPCSCEGNLVECSDRFDLGQASDLDVVFGKLSAALNQTDKRFESLIISNQKNVTHLKANTIKDLVFEDEIIVQFNDNLQSIDENAFSGTDSVTTSLDIEENRALQSVFPLLAKFTKAKDITLANNNITKIPSDAFSGNQGDLIYLSISEPIEQIGTRAFSNLNNLNHLKIINHKVEDSLVEVSQNAFAFNGASNITFYLDIDEANWNLTRALNDKSLLGIGRPTLLTLTSVKVLANAIYSPFLEDNPKNEIQIRQKSLDCNDCANHWIAKSQDLIGRVNDPCSSGARLDSVDNFKNCH